MSLLYYVTAWKEKFAEIISLRYNVGYFQKSTSELLIFRTG
ncbi:MAG: hypothetical protein ACXACX_19855 [Candidatus Hodarchaeales archaeon]